MGKLHSFLVEYPVYGFLLLTFVTSAISFAIMIKVPSTQTPKSMLGLPVWLIAIWSPNIAAFIIWLLKKEFIEKTQLAFSFPRFSWWMLIVLIPLIITFFLLLGEVIKGNNIEWSNFKISYLLPLVFINLVMGPLGEELGWRAFLYPLIKNYYGWMGSALLVGVIWILWHAPLWLIESPQSKIPFWAFAINLLCLSILMGIVYNHSDGSIIPVILFHLAFNLSLGIIDILDIYQASTYIQKSLLFYILLTIILTVLHDMDISA